MKKVLFAAVLGTVFMMTSCGPSVCDCVNEGKALMEKAKEADGDEEKLKALKEEGEALKKKCNALQEGKSKEELRKASENC